MEHVDNALAGHAAILSKKSRQLPWSYREGRGGAPLSWAEVSKLDSAPQYQKLKYVTSERNDKNPREVRKWDENQKEWNIERKYERKPARKTITKMADLNTFTLPEKKRSSLEHHIKTTIAYQSYTRRHMTMHRTRQNKSWSIYTKLWLSNWGTV